MREDLIDGSNEVFVSPASTWEIAIKASLGKIDADLDEVIAVSLETGFLELPIRMTHTGRVRDLIPLHRDPFDRLLLAQALEEGLTLVSNDPVFKTYEVPLLWR